MCTERTTTQDNHQLAGGGSSSSSCPRNVIWPYVLIVTPAKLIFFSVLN
ncbi:hypothetical protein QNH28_08170 [Paenibacillus sp. G2S3]|nr:hypothetical protein [Paenibacillus sp. G2S3]WHY20948.1 hypothetical protein QNH28_08170 [Paenibacillus sp. G2S3]